MADSYKVLSEFYKSEHPDLKDEDDRLVAEFAISENPSDFRTEDFDWEETGFMAGVGKIVGRVKEALRPEETPRELPEREIPARIPGVTGFDPIAGVMVPTEEPVTPDVRLAEAPPEVVEPIIEPPKEIPDQEKLPIEDISILKSLETGTKGFGSSILEYVSIQAGTGVKAELEQVDQQIINQRKAVAAVPAKYDFLRRSKQRALDDLIKHRGTVESRLADVGVTKEQIGRIADRIEASISDEDRAAAAASTEYITNTDNWKKVPKSPIAAARMAHAMIASAAALAISRPFSTPVIRAAIGTAFITAAVPLQANFDCMISSICPR